MAATNAAPFSVLRLSPAPMFILLGIVLGQAFFAWSHRRVAAEKQPLLATEVLDSREERSAVIAFLVAGSLGLAVGFLIPLYVQIVQDRTPLFSAGAVLPYAGAVAVAGVVFDRGGHLVAVDLPGGEIAEVCAGRVVGRGHHKRGR